MSNCVTVSGGRKVFFIFIVLACFVGAVTVSAQDLSSIATSFPMVKAVFAKLLPDLPDFSANVVIGTYATNGATKSKFSLTIALTSARMWQEIDMMNMPLAPQVRSLMQRAGLNKMDIITQVDAGRVFIVFPDIEAYQEFPIAGSILAKMTTEAKAVTIRRRESGQKMIGNHPCKVVKLLATEPNHPPEAALLECAIDLQDFPIQMDLFSRGTITQLSFDDVRIAKPDASLFEVPPSYTKFPTTAAVLHYAKGRLQNSSESTPP